MEENHSVSAIYCVAILLLDDQLVVERVTARSIEVALCVALERWKGKGIKTWTTVKAADEDRLSMEIWEDEVRHVAQVQLDVGHKIAAIKAVRDFTNWDLRECKEYVEKLDSELQFVITSSI